MRRVEATIEMLLAEPGYVSSAMMWAPVLSHQ